MWIIQSINPWSETVGFRFYTDKEHQKAIDDRHELQAANLTALGENMHYNLLHMETDMLKLCNPHTLEVLARDYAAYRANLGSPIF
jgi:hypothetical protein